MSDIYDRMPAEVGGVQRAHNKARLAELLKDADERAERLRSIVLLAQAAGPVL